MSAKQPYEIERKWLMDGWPAGLAETGRARMRQGYIATAPAVRIREIEEGGRRTFVLCFKSAGTLVRREIETDIGEETFRALEDFIGKPLVTKELRTYRLPGGETLEANRVDAGLPTEFYYAEVEFPTVEAARAFVPPAGVGLGQEQTETGFSMSAYWLHTRGEPEQPPAGGGTAGVILHGKG